MSEPIDDLPAQVGRLAASVDARFDAVDKRFDAVEARLDGVEARVDDVDDHLSDLHEFIGFSHFKTQELVTGAINELRRDLGSDIGRLERKLDQFIDSQLRR